jgi:hypothetical protein
MSDHLIQDVKTPHSYSARLRVTFWTRTESPGQRIFMRDHLIQNVKALDSCSARIRVIV